MPDRFLPTIRRIAWRELRHGWRHFLNFLACLALGVAVITTIGTLSTAIHSAMDSEAAALLGGNAEVTLNNGTATPEQRASLSVFGQTSHITTTRSMLRLNGAPLLVEIKAVDSAYPLVGALSFEPSLPRESIFTAEGVAVDQSLLEQLNAKLGDEITLGNASYRINAVLTKEPDRVVQIFTFGPRVMLSHEALKRSGLLQGYSLARHHYRLLFDAEGQLPALEASLKATFLDGTWRLKTGTDGNDSVDRFLDQLTLFLSLSGLATFLIGGIGIGSSVRSYMEKKTESIAVMKTLGASRRHILSIYALVTGILALVGSAIGIAIAAAGAALFLPIVARWLPVDGQLLLDLPTALLAGWYGILITYLFSLPALLNALEIRPSLLFRRSAGIIALPHSGKVWKLASLLTLLLLGTLLLNHQDSRFVLGFAAVALLSFLLFAGCTKAVQAVAKRISVRSPWLRLALGNLHRPGATTGTVILAIGVSLTVLIAVTLTEANFQRRITQVINADAPSLFMMDIQPYQAEELRTMLVDAAGSDESVMMFPMARGRIVALNGQPVDESQVDDDVKWAIRGDRGLSYSAPPPENANITQGAWWSEDYRGEPQISVDERFLKGMELKLGDTISLDILGEEITATITSARRMDYSSFQINFAMMLSPGVIDDFPQTLLATVYLPEGAEKRYTLIRDITDKFPNITTIHTTEAVERVKEVLERIATALSLTVSVSLAAGLLVLSSALSAMLSYRLYDTAVLKVLGARRRDILKAYSSEWMLLATITALIAAGLGTFGAWLIMQRVPGEREFFPMPEVTLATLLGCIAVIWVVGYIGNRQVFRLRPAGLLRNE